MHAHTHKPYKLGLLLTSAYIEEEKLGGENVTTDCLLVRKGNRSGMIPGAQLLEGDWGTCQEAHGRPLAFDNNFEMRRRRAGAANC